MEVLNRTAMEEDGGPDTFDTPLGKPKTKVPDTFDTPLTPLTLL